MAKPMPLVGLYVHSEGFAVEASLGWRFVRVVQIGHQTDLKQGLGRRIGGLKAAEAGEAEGAVLKEGAAGDHERGDSVLTRRVLA